MVKVINPAGDDQPLEKPYYLYPDVEDINDADARIVVQPDGDFYLQEVKEVDGQPHTPNPAHRKELESWVNQQVQ